LSPPPEALDLRRLIDPQEVAFAEPWQAQAYALAYELHRAGVFTWPEWSRTLGARLDARPQNDGSEYYVAWLEALETLVIEKGAASAATLKGFKEAWRTAYETTPHGKPVELNRAR
jgi:nitrile hydratase accessory protein